MKKKVTLEILKSQEKEARRNIIIDAAERVFATKTFDKASMREIADESGMSASSIYRFFPNQESLLVAAAARATRNFNTIFAGLLDRYTDQPEKVFDVMVNSFINFISENDSFFQMMTILMSQGNLNPESSRAIEEVMNDSLDLIENVFKKLNFSHNTRLLSQYIFSSMMGIIVSYNKLPRSNRQNVVSLMKHLGRMTYEFVLICPKNRIESILTPR
jgi:AcrR family transcriptional regulator